MEAGIVNEMFPNTSASCRDRKVTAFLYPGGYATQMLRCGQVEIIWLLIYGHPF